MARSAALWLLALLAPVAGCCTHAVQADIDRRVCDIAARSLDVVTQSNTASEAALPQPSPQPPQPTATATTPPASPDAGKETQAPARPAGSGTEAPPSAEQIKLRDRLRLPPEVPGSTAPPIHLPPPEAPPKEKREALRQTYPPLPPIGEDPPHVPGPGGKDLTLADLQNLAMTNSPHLRQAAADVEAARGAAVQAGAYPNPRFGYKADTAGTGNTAGYQGVFVEQVIKTGGKLKFQEAAALVDLQNAELALRKTQCDVMTQVRTAYFAVLVARENIRVTKALTGVVDEAYRVQFEQARAGSLSVSYEPLQTRVLAVQMRASLLQARNRYVAAQKQLAAAVGLPAMPPTALAGMVDMPVPLYRYDAALTRVLSRHTDVLTAGNAEAKARANLALARATPVPDVDLQVAVQKDYTVPPFNIVQSVQMSVPVPVFDRNRGAITQAEGQLIRATEEAHRVRDDLTTRLAAAFEQYDDNRRMLEYYRGQMLPDQVRAYRALFERHLAEPDKVSFGDVTAAQLSLAGTISTYLATEGALWSAVVGVADLLQTDDMFQLGPEADTTFCLPSLPDLEHLAPLPCCHPCSPLPDPALKGASGDWPGAGSAPAAEPSPSPARSETVSAPAPRRPGSPPDILPAPQALPRWRSATMAAPVPGGR